MGNKVGKVKRRCPHCNREYEVHHSNTTRVTCGNKECVKLQSEQTRRKAFYRWMKNNPDKWNAIKKRASEKQKRKREEMRMNRGEKRGTS